MNGKQCAQKSTTGRLPGYCSCTLWWLADVMLYNERCAAVSLVGKSTNIHDDWRGGISQWRGRYLSWCYVNEHKFWADQDCHDNTKNVSIRPHIDLTLEQRKNKKGKALPLSHHTGLISTPSDHRMTIRYIIILYHHKCSIVLRHAVIRRSLTWVLRDRCTQHLIELYLSRIIQDL